MYLSLNNNNKQFSTNTDHYVRDKEDENKLLICEIWNQDWCSLYKKFFGFIFLQ